MRIPLTKGKYTLVDDRDYGYLMGWKWQVLEGKRGRYCAKRSSARKRGEKRKNIYMHRIIMHYDGNMDIDHINGNALDNRRSNLRICTRSQNHHNAGLRSDNKSGYRGISWREDNKTWAARIDFNNTSKHLGCFENIEDAVLARREAEEQYVGEFSFSNR